MQLTALGRTKWLYDSIISCHEAGHEIISIVTSAASPEYDVDAHHFEVLACDLNCGFLTDIDLSKGWHSDIFGQSDLAISVNWPTLIGPQVLSQFPLGIINAHIGDLPRYRGNACPNWAIINGENDLALTLHYMDEGLDSGPILLKRRFQLDDDTYISDIYEFASVNIPDMFVNVLEGVEYGTLETQPQPRDPRKSLRCFPRLPQDGFIDWNAPAKQTARLVRASSDPFPGAFTYWGSSKLIIWRAREGRLNYPYSGAPGQVAEIDRRNGGVTVITGEGVIVLEEVSCDESMDRQAAAEVIRSTRARLGVSWAELVEQVRPG